MSKAKNWKMFLALGTALTALRYSLRKPKKHNVILAAWRRA